MKNVLQTTNAIFMAASLPGFGDRSKLPARRSPGLTQVKPPSSGYFAGALP